jgi:hypothetical protein
MATTWNPQVPALASSGKQMLRIRGLTNVDTGNNRCSYVDPIYGGGFLLAPPELTVGILNSVIV